MTPGRPTAMGPSASQHPRRHLRKGRGHDSPRTGESGQPPPPGGYALGYGAIGLAQQEGDQPGWWNDMDPLDALFLGTVWPQLLRDSYEFGNARTAWLAALRDTAHWAGIERFRPRGDHRPRGARPAGR